MKITIEYGYNPSIDHPFIAKTEINGAGYFELSDESFIKAELRLIHKIENIIHRPIKIPSPKEIEIGE